MTSPLTPRVVPNAYQMTVRMTDRGQTAAVVLGLLDSDAAAPSMDASNAAAWLAAWWSSMRIAVGTNLVCTGATVRDLGSVGGSVWEVAPPADPAGAGASAGAVAAACALLKWRTADGTRSGKGRTFLPGIAQVAIDTDGRSLTTGARGAVLTQAQVYLGKPLFTGTFGPAVISFKNQVARRITSVDVATTVAIQRNRMRA